MSTKFEGSEKQRLALDLFIKLERASNSVSYRINSFIVESGLTVSQFGTLEVLHHLGPLHQNEIGEKLLKTGGNITMVVDNLQKRDLVKRIRSKEDRRYIKRHLTDKGQEWVSRIFPEHVNHIEHEMSVLDVEEQKQLNALLRKLGKGAEEKTKKEQNR